MHQVVTRFAPSPTGLLHLGSAYSALVAWTRLAAQQARALFAARRVVERVLIERFTASATREQLAALGNCVHCHTREEGERLAGGRAMHTPFGVVHTTNLSPDVETGIGTWSFAAFQRAMREGISRDGRHLYPAFPYTAFSRMTDEDMLALYAWLMSQPAVAASPPETQLAFPFNWRPGMVLWNALFHTGLPVQADASKSDAWNRGAYLVEGLGHCAMCHNENKLVGNSSLAGRFGGGVIDGWYAPNITPDGHQGIGAWSDEEIKRSITQGVRRDGSKLLPPMGYPWYARMTDADLNAIVAYLRTVPPKE